MTRVSAVSVGIAALGVAAETKLTITTGTQSGFFKTGSDVGSLNPHDYRPNEFVTSDFIFEGLTEWDPDSPNGVDGLAGTDDDFVKPALAESWTTNKDQVIGSGGQYWVKFNLREGVTFHDGSAWDADACKANFDQILGGDGSPGGSMALRGFHDWMGFTQSVDGWEVVDQYTFKLTFQHYYEAVFRELSFIRPFRFTSVATLPSMADGELSHIAFKWGAPRMFPWKCWAADFVPSTLSHGFRDTPFPVTGSGTDPCYIMRGITAPVGTGPYKVTGKKLNTGTIVPPSDFNASCYHPNPDNMFSDLCKYDEAGEKTVSEVIFEKVEGHRKNPSYDKIVLKSYDSLNDINAALRDGSLDIAYGVNTLSPSSFLSLATAEEGANVVAHKGQVDLNTRLLVLNSAGRLNTPDLRKVVYGILANARAELYGGELAEEEPMNTMYDPAAPHCAVLSTLDTPEEVAATKSSTVTAASITQPLRFMYKPDVPHEAMIAAWVISHLVEAGIQVTPMPVSKAGYNDRNCDYMDFVYYGDDPDHPYYDDDYHSWDIAYSETWGPPYDPTSKLWDMTHGELSGWCSQEADAPAVTNMASMDYTTFAGKVRQLSTTVDYTAREALYSEVLTTIHNEAIFLPITAVRQTAVTSTSVAGFKFGFGQYDLPLANLAPASSVDPSVSIPGSLGAKGGNALGTNAIIGIAVAAGIAAFLLLFVIFLICREKQGKPIFTNIATAPDGKHIAGTSTVTVTSGSAA